MDITYKKVGDYYYPELELPKKYKDFRLDKYGRLRLNYLKTNKLMLTFIVTTIINEILLRFFTVNN